MKKLSNAQEAIEEAIEGGYLGGKAFATYRHSSRRIVYEIDDNALPKLTKSINEALTDPLFWKALGKVRGWKEEQMKSIREKEKESGYHIIEKDICEKMAEIWFRTKISNGDETKYWQSLP